MAGALGGPVAVAASHRLQAAGGPAGAGQSEGQWMHIRLGLGVGWGWGISEGGWGSHVTREACLAWLLYVSVLFAGVGDVVLAACSCGLLCSLLILGGVVVAAWSCGWSVQGIAGDDI